MKALIYTCLILFVLFTACMHSDTASAEECIRELEGMSNFRKSEYSRVVFIPETGCVGCISSTLRFLIENQEQLSQMKYAFVFVDVLDKKKLRNKIGYSLYNSDNVYLLYNCWKYQPLTKPMEVILRNGNPIQIAAWEPHTISIQ